MGEFDLIARHFARLGAEREDVALGVGPLLDRGAPCRLSLGGDAMSEILSGPSRPTTR